VSLRWKKREDLGKQGRDWFWQRGECVLDLFERLTRMESKLWKKTGAGIIVVHKDLRNFKTWARNPG